MSRYNTAKIIKNSIYALFTIIIIGYALYNSRIFIAGPQIDILRPQNGETITESPLIRVQGEARNIAFMELNNKQIDTNEESKFNEPVLLYPGYNVITIFAKDKFGRTVEKQIELVYKGEDSNNNIIENILETATTSLETSTSSPVDSLEEF
jgi:hypothetical protein